MGESMNQTTISRQDIDTLRTIWSDHIGSAVPKPSQFAVWLRMYSIDICAEGFKAGSRWLTRKGDQDVAEVIRYVSACMRNMKELRDLDAEVGDG
jgi:hypothetical protein